MTTPNRIKLLFGRPISTTHEHIFWNIGSFRSHIKEYTPGELTEVVEWACFDVSQQALIDKNARKRLVEANDSLLERYVLKLYLQMTSLRDTFKDTQIIKARKPEGWRPVEPDVGTFADHYEHLDKYNLDDVSGKSIVKSIQLMQSDE